MAISHTTLTSGSGTSTGISDSVNNTSTADHQILILLLSAYRSADAPFLDAHPTYGGQSMTQISAGIFTAWGEILYIYALSSPPTGSNTLAVEFTPNPTDWFYQMIVIENVTPITQYIKDSLEFYSATSTSTGSRSSSGITTDSYRTYGVIFTFNGFNPSVTVGTQIQETSDLHGPQLSYINIGYVDNSESMTFGISPSGEYRLYLWKVYERGYAPGDGVIII